MAQTRLFFIPAWGDYQSGGWRPAVDVYRLPGGWLIKCDLAGVRPQDIQISISGRQLVLSGTRRDCSLVEHAEVHSMEITYDRFERTVELPFELGKAEVETEYRDGMLLVHLWTKGKS